MTNNHLLFVTPKFAGITETFIYRHATGFKRFKVTVLAYQRLNEELFPAPGIDVFVHSPHPMTLWRKLVLKFDLQVDRWKWPRSSLALAERLCRERNIVAILAQYGHVGISSLPLARKLGLPLLVFFHGSDASALLENRKYVSLLKAAWPDFAAIAVCSNYLGEKLKKLGAPPERIAVIHYGVPIPESLPERPSDRAPLFLHVGRLTEKKGPLYSIRAFAKIQDLLPGSKLLMVGPGELRAACESLIKELGMEEKVLLLGAMPQPQIQELMKKADVFVQHSVAAPNGDTEGLPVSILEAQAHGLPVISTLHAGIPEEVVEGKTGFLVPERDVEAMAERMLVLGRDPLLRKRMGEAARELVKEKFELEKQNQKLEQLLLETIARREGRPV